MRLLISNFSRIGPAKAGQNYPRGEHALTKKILRRISSTLPRTSRLKQGTASKKKSANKRAPGRNTSATWQIRCCARPASSIPTFRLLQLTFAFLGSEARGQHPADIDEVVGNDSQTYPAMHARIPFIEAAAESVASLEHADAPF